MMNNISIDDDFLPRSIEAEQAILGDMMIRQENHIHITSTIKTEYFFSERHQAIYSSMLYLYENSIGIETTSIVDILKKNNLFTTQKDKEYVIKLFESASVVNKIEYFTNIVKEKALLRRFIVFTSELSNEGINNASLLELLEKNNNNINNLLQDANVSHIHKLEELALERINRLGDMAQDTTGKYLPKKSGINSLDNLIGGFNNSDLMILAARPGVGKTSFALNLAYNMASAHLNNENSEKKCVAIFSLEMSKEELADRFISSCAMVNSQKIREGKLDVFEWESIYSTYTNIFTELDIYIDDSTNINVVKIKNQIKQMKKVDLIIVDYLQLMQSERRTDNRNNEISELTRGFKLMAKELNVPVLLLSQMSRNIEQRGKEDKAPKMSDLRDSGAIEQDADLIMFLNKPDIDPTIAPDNKVELIVAKNRHGKTGKLNLIWNPDCTLFSD